MPQHKRPAFDTKVLDYFGVLESWNFYDYIAKDDVELKRCRVLALYKVCSKFSQETLDRKLYFVGFGEYDFWEELEGIYGQRKIIKCKLTSLNREFEVNLTTGERYYWGKVFTERMVYELACFLGVDEYFTYGTPWKAMNNE